MQDNFSIRNWKNKTVHKEEYNAGAAKVQEQEDDIELEIPGDETTATVDKSADVKARGQDAKIKQAKAEFKQLEDQMKTHLELYKTSESPANKETAKNMLRKLTPEFQAAKKAYEKLVRPSVKI